MGESGRRGDLWGKVEIISKRERELYREKERQKEREMKRKLQEERQREK